MSQKKAEINSFYPLFFTAAFILLLIQYPFSDVEAIFYDLWAKFHYKQSQSSEIVMVSLDESNDQILGEYYPYTYATHNRFLKEITRDNPKAIVYFVNFDEPILDDDEKYYKDFIETIRLYKNKGNVFRFGTSIDQWGEQVPPEKLKPFGYSPAVINVDGENFFAKDYVHRRALTTISGENTLHLWLANELRPAEDSLDLWGTFYDSESDATFVYYRHLFNLLKKDSYIIDIPFYRIVNGDIPPGFFKDKIVLIGPQYQSNSDDFVLTSFSKERKVSKLFVHASLINSFIKEKTLYPISDLVTDIFALVMAILLSFLISRVQPTKGLIITFVLMISIVLVAYVLFNVGVWLKIAHIIMSIFIVYYIWIPFRAISEYQTRYAVEEESMMLKKVENLKQNFISLMSHDLKTPVAKIAGIADILKLKIGHDTAKIKLVDDIITSTKELNKFITSILDLTKIESQNLQINKSSKDVNKIIESVVGSLEFEAESKKITVERDLSPLYPIELDQNLMHRVLSNLVENAIKYSGEGSKVEIKTHDDDEWVYIEIQDTGPGIAEQDIGNIFEKFYRVKNDSTHAIKGSGLGLYLVKYFIELHNGEISVSSELGKGTRFIIKLINR